MENGKAQLCRFNVIVNPEVEVQRHASTMEEIQHRLNTEKFKRQQELELHQFLSSHEYHNIVTQQLSDMAAQHAQQHADLLAQYNELRMLLDVICPMVECGYTESCVYEKPLPFSFARFIGSSRVHPECACRICASLR